MVIHWKNHDQQLFFFVFLLCFIFFLAYSLLTVVRHMHYQSFGYDLGINNQVVWRYSHFQAPITTSDPYPTESKLIEHIELVYAFIAPFYWIWSSSRMLILVEAFAVCSGGIPLFLLARRKKLHPFLAISIVISYLAFYGVQNGIWFDVHSASFAAAFLCWFIYFLDAKKLIWTSIFFFLAITTKENIGLLTLLISFIYFLKRRDLFTFILMEISLGYLIFIYLIYFPFLTPHPYLYQNKNGLLSNLNPLSLINTAEKRETILYSIGAFGFLPLLLPLFLLPALGDFATYFILASDLTAAQGLSMHYRITLAPLLVWATIMTLAHYKKLNTIFIAIYLLLCTIVVQYTLHLPLSYLTKSWFWTEPSGVKYINQLRSTLLPTDSIVAQNNIIPHISQRDRIYTLYPETKEFMTNSPCGKEDCDWFHWYDSPTYLFVDTSPEWDARHLLTNRDNFIAGLQNMEKEGIIEKYRTDGTATIYKIKKNPDLN